MKPILYGVFFYLGIDLFLAHVVYTDMVAQRRNLYVSLSLYICIFIYTYIYIYVYINIHIYRERET